MKVTVPNPGSPAPAARVFRTAEVARILGMPAERVRAVARAGLCQPTRRAGLLQFSFQDLVLLRAAQGLLEANVPTRRLRRALAQLARQLPSDRPLSGVRIYADGRQVVARDRRAAWRPESGQIVFTFAVDELARQAGVVIPVRRQRARAKPVKPASTQDAAACFERGLLLEEQDDPEGARTAYQSALDLDPTLGDAYINLGRLFHEAGASVEAARLYHHALDCEPSDPIAHYNLALALEDEQRSAAALAHYQRALELDPDFADAHFNLSQLLERLGQRSRAMHHLRAYHRLTRRS